MGWAASGGIPPPRRPCGFGFAPPPVPDPATGPSLPPLLRPSVFSWPQNTPKHPAQQVCKAPFAVRNCRDAGDGTRQRSNAECRRKTEAKEGRRAQFIRTSHFKLRNSAGPVSSPSSTISGKFIEEFHDGLHFNGSIVKLFNELP